MLRFLSEALVLAIHEDQIRLYGGSYSVRDVAALDAALKKKDMGMKMRMSIALMNWLVLSSGLVSF